MNKLPKPTHEFDVPIYGVQVVFSNSEKKFAKIAKMHNIEKDVHELPAGMTALVQNVEDGTYKILVGVFDKDLSTLVHELGHATMFILNTVGIDPTDSAGETFCYLQGYLFNELADKV